MSAPGATGADPLAAGATAIDVAEAVRAGEVRAVEVLDACLARIEAGNAGLNAFVHLDEGRARRAAEAVDRAVAAGADPGPLAGVPIGVKDLEDCEGMPTSHGSLRYLHWGPVDHDSIHVARLRAAGAVPVGKTAAPELGTLQYTRTHAWGTTRNPWDPARTPGGSSGGTAAAVAAGLVPLGTASDGGGSTRIPASFSGLVGLKATFGRIPSPHPGTSQTAVLGALTTTVADSARHLDVAAGPDHHDRTSLPPPGLRYEAELERTEVGGLRALWSPDLGYAAVEPEVVELARGAAEALVAAAGLVPTERELALTDPVRTWLGQGAVDLWAEHDPHDWLERPDELTPTVRVAVELSQRATAASIGRSFRRRWELEDQVADLFGEVDVLLTPATAVPAFPAEGPPPAVIAGREVHAAMSVPFTMLANLCGNPSASVPAGMTTEGLPVGLLITAPRFAEHVVLRLARIAELARPWPRLAPWPPAA